MSHSTLVADNFVSAIAAVTRMARTDCGGAEGGNLLLWCRGKRLAVVVPMTGTCCSGADGRDLLWWCGRQGLAVVVRMAGTCCCGVADGWNLLLW